jgi:hypothetical protein
MFPGMNGEIRWERWDVSIVVYQAICEAVPVAVINTVDDTVYRIMNDAVGAAVTENRSPPHPNLDEFLSGPGAA